MSKVKEITEFLLEMYELEDILEMNDLTPHEVLEYLIEGGYIAQPERILQELEESLFDEETEESDL